jgi:hypothetical protein
MVSSINIETFSTLVELSVTATSGRRFEWWYFYPYCTIGHYRYKDKRTASDLSSIRTASDLSTIQFRLIFKGHKYVETVV